MKFVKILPIIAIALLAACRSTVPQSESLLEECVSSSGEISSSSVTEYAQESGISSTPESSSNFSSSSLPIAWDDLMDSLTLEDVAYYPFFCFNLPEDSPSPKDTVKILRLAECSLKHAIYYALADDKRFIGPWDCGTWSDVAACKVQFKDNKLLLNVLSEERRVKTSVTIADGIATIQEKFSSIMSETKFDEFCNFHKNDSNVAHVECFDKTIIYTMKEKFIINDMKVLVDDFDFLCRGWLAINRPHCEMLRPNEDY